MNNPHNHHHQLIAQCNYQSDNTTIECHRYKHRYKQMTIIAILIRSIKTVPMKNTKNIDM